MSRLRRILLLIEALFELLRYDLTDLVLGFRGVMETVRRTQARGGQTAIDTATVSRAIETAMSCYLKPVRCLHRATVTVRMLRRRGTPAELVIGYRQIPFLSHAWVELNGQMVNETSGYQKTLQVLVRA